MGLWEDFGPPPLLLAKGTPPRSHTQALSRRRKMWAARPFLADDYENSSGTTDHGLLTTDPLLKSPLPLTFVILSLPATPYL